MNNKDDQTIKEVLLLINKYDSIPHRIGSVIGKFAINLNNYLPFLNRCINQTKTPDDEMMALFDAMVALADKITTTMKQSYDMYCQLHQMTTESPWSILMLLFVLCGSLMLIVEDSWTTYKKTPKPWQYIGPSSDFEYVLTSGLCYDTSKAIKSYTVSDMRASIELLSTNWHSLVSTPSLRRYIRALYHRALILCVHPSYCNVMDVESMRKPYCGDRPDVYMMNAHGIRFFSGVFVRMMFISEISVTVQPGDMQSLYATVAGTAEGDIAKIREFITKQAGVVRNSNEMRATMSGLFPRLALLHGDVERFWNERGKENARPQTIMMTVRPETQEAYSKLHQFLLYEQMARIMCDEDPLYFSKWTRAEHAYCILLKTSMVDMILKGTSVDFVSSYVCYEIDLPMHFSKFVDKRFPVVIQLFGRLHVVFADRLYQCTCIEHAIAVWIRIVLVHLDGCIDNVRISDKITSLISSSRAAVGQSRDAVGAASDEDVDEGEIKID